nr:PREDICTED: tetraspanin-10 [Latimeria chalumnae]|eukprot:XP_005988136.2 PREDICTED: tetraspanin-10 [Latimeria chalumnae]
MSLVTHCLNNRESPSENQEVSKQKTAQLPCCCPHSDGAEMNIDLGRDGRGKKEVQKDSETKKGDEKLRFLEEKKQYFSTLNLPNRYMKYLMFLFNFFTVLGIFILAVGIWGLIDKESLVEEQISYIGTDPMLFFVLVGVIVSVMSFSGCMGALRENECLLKFFTLCIVLFVVLEVLGGIIVYTLRKQIWEHLENGIQMAVRRYQDDPDLRFIIDEIQMGLKCCGVKSYHDWERNLYFNCSSPGVHACGVPASCCIDPLENGTVTNSQCGFGTLHLEVVLAQNFIYPSGCMAQIIRWINNHMGFIGAFGIILMIIEVVGLLLATKIMGDIELIKANCTPYQLAIIHQHAPSTGHRSSARPINRPSFISTPYQPAIVHQHAPSTGHRSSARPINWPSFISTPHQLAIVHQHTLSTGHDSSAHPINWP